MIDFYTAATPNGWKVAIALEELGLDYRVHAMDLSQGAHKTPDYLALNPNGKIPVIVDRSPSGEELTLSESGAILFYLAEKAGRLLPDDPFARARVLQWVMFQMSALGPMMGQAAVFHRYAPERIPFAIERYQREVRRILEVMNGQLAGREYFLGEFGLADIAHYPWAMSYGFVGVDIDGLDDLAKWLGRMAGRPSVKKGMSVPNPVNFEAIDEKEIEQRRTNLT